jgi:hypothetical protein
MAISERYYESMSEHQIFGIIYSDEGTASIPEVTHVVLLVICTILYHHVPLSNPSPWLIWSIYLVSNFIEPFLIDLLVWNHKVIDNVTSSMFLLLRTNDRTSILLVSLALKISLGVDVQKLANHLMKTF